MVALVAVMILANLTIPAVKNLIALRKTLKVNYQDEIGIYQLQLTLAVNDIKSVSRNQIRYRTSENDCVLRIVNDKLISQPGTVDFIHGIDDCYFEVVDNIVCLCFTREKKEYWPIAYYSP